MFSSKEKQKQKKERSLILPHARQLLVLLTLTGLRNSGFMGKFIGYYNLPTCVILRDLTVNRKRYYIYHSFRKMIKVCQYR